MEQKKEEITPSNPIMTKLVAIYTLEWKFVKEELGRSPQAPQNHPMFISGCCQS